MNYIGFATWFSIGAAVACIPYLRWKCPELERPIKVHLAFPIIYIVMTLVKKTQMKIMKSIKDLMGVPENCLHVGCSFCVRQPVFDSFRSIYLFL